jgi:hypothetical protein
MELSLLRLEFAAALYTERSLDRNKVCVEEFVPSFYIFKTNHNNKAYVSVKAELYNSQIKDLTISPGSYCLIDNRD